MEIPVRATIASGILTVMFLVLYIIYLSFEFFWSLLIAVHVYSIIPLPLILLFTIRQKNDQKHICQPPIKLQFHNENFKSGISHPLQFHENFDTSSPKSVEQHCSENVNVIQNPSSTQNDMNQPNSLESKVVIHDSSSIQNDMIQPNSSESKVKSTNVSVSKNIIFDKIDVLSITEIQC